VKAILAFAMCFAIAEARSQGRAGVQLGMGLETFIDNGGYSVSMTYFHPLLFKQIYATGGLYAHESAVRVVAPVAEPAVPWFTPEPYSYFRTSRGAAVGLQIGEWVFVRPSLSYNFYGDYNSPGWGFSGGLLIHPNGEMAVGFSIDYARLRFDHTLDAYGPVETTDFVLLLRIKFPGADQSAALPPR